MPQPKRKQFKVYLVDEGVPEKWADKISGYLDVTDMSGWSDKDIDDYVDLWIEQVPIALKSAKPASYIENLWYSIQQGGLGAAFDLQISPKPKSVELKIGEFVPEELPTTAFFDTTALRNWFIENGVAREKAIQLANQMSKIDVSKWSDSFKANYLADRLQEDLSEKIQGMSAFAGQYNPRTGQLWSEEMAREPIEAEQVSITQANKVRELRALVEEKTWYEQQPDMPSYVPAGAVATERLRELSPAMQRYYEQELPNIYAQAGMPEARAKWQAQRTMYPGAEPMGLGGEGWETLTPEEQVATEAPHRAYEGRLKEQKALVDPWETFLAQYPFLEKYKGLTPREKGFYSGLFRPRTRYLG